MRTIMISDIHGCFDELNRLLLRIEYDSAKDKLILLGDYVDRGPRGREVVDQAMDLVRNHGAIALRGNHDQRLYDLVMDGGEAVREKFLAHGGLQTLHSYCEVPAALDDDAWERAIDTIRTRYPHHLEFLGHLPLFAEDRDHIYVHAGLNPRYDDWKTQSAHDFMYIKDEFIRARFSLGKKVVFGHTRTMDIHGSPEIWFGEDKIGIDGGCAYGMQLNALLFRDGVYETARVRRQPEGSER